MFLKPFDAGTMYEVAYNITKKQEGEEIWLPVVGYEDLYEVSNSGRVRRQREAKAKRKNESRSREGSDHDHAAHIP